MKIHSRLARIVPAAAAALASAATAVAVPVTYTIEPDHTYPSFTADHMGGLSKWRGKFNRSEGTVVLDREARTGTLEVRIDTASIDFGHDKLNEHARSPDMFDVGRYPVAVYKGTLTKFEKDRPTEVQGTLTLKGVTRPVVLRIGSFLCKKHPMRGKEVCGADASATFDRAEFGVSYGKDYGFDMRTDIAIQVEALRADMPPAPAELKAE